MPQVDEYLEKVSSSQRNELEKIRRFIKKEVPDAIEVVSYGMPGFKYNNKYLIGYAAFKNHMSLFPTSAPVAALKERLERFKLSKGTIQFTKENPIPENTIKELLSKRISDISRG